MAKRLFDLNIEEILENWEVSHAIREIIANAFDEQIISNTGDVQIYKDRHGNYRIRDFGRGIQIEHFTLNENKEKLSYPSGVIGKFGVGLKDALATLNRHNVSVIIDSSSGIFNLREATKHGFNNIVTLHIEYDDRPIKLQGTEVVLRGVSDTDITQAKSMFMKFSDEEEIESTPYGQIMRKKGDIGRIYINGVLANEEQNFLFSYNITSLTETMKKRLTRERLNVGRTTYTDRVKAILKSANSKNVQDSLADQVYKRSIGTQCDEMQWIEISQLAFNLLHDRQKVAFVTESELQARPNIMDNIRRDGFDVMVVSDTQKVKLDEQILDGGKLVYTVDVYVKEFNESFQYKFIEPTKLTSFEKRIFDLTPRLFELIGIDNLKAPKVLISETMRVTNDDTGGVWDGDQQAIIIKRSQLISPLIYAGTLLHETAHALTGKVDATREFEDVLTRYLGQCATASVR